jgi:hypothetical protein
MQPLQTYYHLPLLQHESLAAAPIAFLQLFAVTKDWYG